MGSLYNEYVETLNENDFKKKILSRTLCKVLNRANCQQLLRILFPNSNRLPREGLMRAGDEHNPFIFEICSNSARDELFLADNENKVVRSILVRLLDNAGELRDICTEAAQRTAHQMCTVCVT